MRRRDVKAVASVVPAADNMDPTNAGGPRQDPAPQPHNLDLTVLKVSVPVSRDDFNVSTSTTTPENSSARARSLSFDAASNMSSVQLLLSNFEQFLEEQRLRGISYDVHPLTSPPVVQPQHVEPVQPPPIPNPQCLICCKTLPKEQDADYSKEVVKPCRSCKHDYCVDCVKKTFTDACKDSSRMPPRCCVPINLHIARPYLTEEEAQLFRRKYEEWSTPSPFYCPVPVCSAFIPERLLPRNARPKDKQRVDSGVGTPTAAAFACPTCEASICIDCRQVAHPGSICSMNEFGLDAETAALLKQWGYKKCPKCGHGVKRMFGCNHMECRCGSHFCWTCLENIEVCDGGCADDDDEDHDSDDGQDEEDEEGEANRASTAVAEHQAVDVATGELAAQATVAATEGALASTMSPQAPARPRNLDGGSARYWANTELNFGDEPTNEIQDRAWDCRHQFISYKVPFATALASQTADMECVKCWNIIHPEIEAPKAVAAQSVKTGQAAASRERLIRGHERTGARIGAGRARYQPPRGLFRADATIGTAPHLTTNISPLSQSVPARLPSPMEDVQFGSRVVDTYGNVITTTQMLYQPQRRASLDMSQNDTTASREASSHQTSGSTKPNSTIFSTPSASFSLAHECRHCQIVVCDTCKAASDAAQEERDKAAELTAQEAIDRETREREEINALPLTLPLPEPEPAVAVPAPEPEVDELEMATPSLFD